MITTADEVKYFENGKQILTGKLKGSYWIIRTLKTNPSYNDANARNDIRDTFETAIHSSFAVIESQHESSDNEDESKVEFEK